MTKVNISKKEYEELIDSQNKLNALEAGGVDNWEWYSESLKNYFANKELEADVNAAESRLEIALLIEEAYAQ